MRVRKRLAHKDPVHSTNKAAENLPFEPIPTYPRAQLQSLRNRCSVCKRGCGVKGAQRATRQHYGSAQRAKARGPYSQGWPPNQNPLCCQWVKVAQGARWGLPLAWGFLSSRSSKNVACAQANPPPWPLPPSLQTDDSESDSRLRGKRFE